MIRLLKQKLPLFAIIATSALTAALVIILYKSQETDTPPELNKWVEISYTPIAVTLDVVGHLESNDQLTISAPFEGEVAQLGAREDQWVKKGQNILSLNTQALDIQLRQSLAELLKAKRATREMDTWAQSQEVARARRTMTTAQLSKDDTQKKLLDAEQLLSRGIVARMEVDALSQQLKVQLLDFASAQSELALALGRGEGEYKQIATMELQNSQSRYDSLIALKEKKSIIAPFSGILVRPSAQGTVSSGKTAIQVGSRVSEGSPLFDLISTEGFHVLAQIDETDVAQLQEGQRVQVTSEGFKGTMLTGVIESISAKATASESTGRPSYGVIVTLLGSAPHQIPSARLGMSVNLSINIYSNESGLVVPLNAIQAEPGEGKITITYKKSENSSAVTKDVSVGHSLQSGVEAFGLEPGLLKIR